MHIQRQKNYPSSSSSTASLMALCKKKRKKNAHFQHTVWCKYKMPPFKSRLLTIIIITLQVSWENLFSDAYGNGPYSNKPLPPTVKVTFKTFTSKAYLSFLILNFLCFLKKKNNLNMYQLIRNQQPKNYSI